ncbi:hypothetical protein MARU1_000382 [Malassezia arunalokei]|uniref:Uncharacterized protein n=1 Tax=Malassezia arunalokei TaxID=1514897 RepID=A0AAJ6CKG6_9BASI|nr:hypothetical protein MARU1_000382 [Malassezia arunalokei]
MSSKGLSSRLQGLKFMQRAAARDELKDAKPSPAPSKANFPAEGMSGDETEAKDVSRNAEHWVVPVDMRVKTQSIQHDTCNWDSWFQKATETDLVPARQQFGSWKGRRNQDDDEFEEDVSNDDENSYDDNNDESFSSAPSSPAEKGFLKPPSAPQSSQPAQKRRASSTWDEPSRSKLAAVADKSQGLRRKKQR